MRSLSPINMTEKGGGKEMEKKRGKKKNDKEKSRLHGDEPRIHPRVSFLRRKMRVRD